jgi:hypothetical protein
MAKKSQPLSLEDLLESQKTMLTASNLTEEQRKRAEDQIAKLEELRQATIKSQEKQTEVVEQVKVMTRAKGDSRNVTLGDVRTELKGMRQDLKTFAGTDPNPSRKPLSRQRDDVIDVDFKEVSGKKDNKERTQKLTDIGATLGEKAELYQKGAGKEVTMAKNTETFERFVAETKRKDELLKDATDDQIKLFERLEDTLIKLRDSDAKDSAELRKELAKIAGELETTEDTAAKKSVSGVLENTRNRARSGARGDSGTLGDAWSVLTGKQKVLKEGYEFDPRLKGDGVRRTTENEFGKKGEIPKKGEVFSMGRVAGAAKIAGNFLRGKVEDYNATNASNAGSNFLDRTFGGNRLEEDRARLGARAEALSKSRDGQTAASPTPVFAGRGQPMPMATPAGRSGSAGVMNITATVVNLRGPLKLPASGGPGWSAGNAGAGAGKDWPPKATVTATTPAPMAAAAKPEEESSGFSLPDLNIMDRGKGILSRAGRGIMSAGRGILSTGKNLLGKVPGGVLKGGVAALGGAALSYGGDKLKEAGYEKTGAAVDVAGQAASWGGTGAMLGSMIAPGVGTAIGAGAGALAGGAYGLYKNWGSLFGGKKSENGQATVTPQSNAAQPAAVNPSAATKATMIADEPVVPGQALTEKQMATIGMSKSMGNSYSADVEKQYQQQLAKSSVTPAAPNGTANKNVAIENLSKNNAAAKEANNKPVVINQPAAPAPAPAPAPANNMMVPRGQVRSTESAMERYSTRNAHFY